MISHPPDEQLEQLNFLFFPALEVFSDHFYILGEVLIGIDESKLFLEGFHFHVRHPITDTLVSLEHDLFALWGVHNPVCECVTCYTIPIVLKLGDGEEVRNAFFIDTHIKKAEHTLACARSNARVTAPPLRKVFNLRMFLRHHVPNMEW